MSPDLDARLCADFPQLYSVCHGDRRGPVSHFGFETDDGWFQIIQDLSASLEAIIEGRPAGE